VSFLQIDSPQNSTIKSIAKLRTRRGRLRQQRIIIDGNREVSRAMECGVEIESVLLPDKLAADASPDSDQGKQLKEWSERVEVVTVSERAFAKIAFGQRQEVVAVAKAPNRSLPLLTLPKSPRLIAVLEAIEKPGNVGAVMRSADAAGIDAVILVDAATDLFNPNAIRASLGTIFSLQVAVASFEEYVDWNKEHSFQHVLAKCDASATTYRDADVDGDVAVVLGSEAHGLSDRWGIVDRTVNITIPMRGIADSLNISASAAVLFYQYQR
jgi:TrmH family RNA methyltransferase